MPAIKPENLAYLVYRYKGQILVKKGYKSSVFYSANNVSHYHTGIPDEFMKVNSKGKILVKNEEDIPKAIKMLQEYYANKLTEVGHNSVMATNNTLDVINQSDYVIK
jgi:hypothetical protein